MNHVLIGEKPAHVVKIAIQEHNRPTIAERDFREFRHLRQTFVGDSSPLSIDLLSSSQVSQESAYGIGRVLPCSQVVVIQPAAEARLIENLSNS